MKKKPAFPHSHEIDEAGRFPGAWNSALRPATDTSVFDPDDFLGTRRDREEKAAACRQDSQEKAQPCDQAQQKIKETLTCA